MIYILLMLKKAGGFGITKINQKIIFTHNFFKIAEKYHRKHNLKKVFFWQQICNLNFNKLEAQTVLDI